MCPLDESPVKVDNPIRRVAIEYQKVTNLGLPFSGSDDDLLNAMVEDWEKSYAMRRKLFVALSVIDEIRELTTKLPAITLKE